MKMTNTLLVIQNYAATIKILHQIYEKQELTAQAFEFIYRAFRKACETKYPSTMTL